MHMQSRRKQNRDLIPDSFRSKRLDDNLSSSMELVPRSKVVGLPMPTRPHSWKRNCILISIFVNLRLPRQTPRSRRSQLPAQHRRPAHGVLLLRKQGGGHARIVVPRYWGLSARAIVGISSGESADVRQSMTCWLTLSRAGMMTESSIISSMPGETPCSGLDARGTVSGIVSGGIS